MDSIGNFPKTSLCSYLEKIVVFAFTNVLPKVLPSFNTISAFDIYSVDSDEAMKR
jgi:hypothetical protein